MFKFFKKKENRSEMEMEMDSVKVVEPYDFVSSYKFFKTEYAHLKYALEDEEAITLLESYKGRFSEDLVDLLIYVYENIDDCKFVAPTLFIGGGIGLRTYQNGRGGRRHFGHHKNPDIRLGDDIISAVLKNDENKIKERATNCSNNCIRVALNRIGDKK